MAKHRSNNKNTKQFNAADPQLTDTNFMDVARLTCACIDSTDAKNHYDESQYSNDSIPMTSHNDSESIVQESSNSESQSTSPPDIVLSDAEKISESESDSVSGISSDQESDESAMYADIKNSTGGMGNTSAPSTVVHSVSEKHSGWSATATMEEMVRAEGTQIHMPTFQVFVTEMIRDKCWDEQDFKDFIKSMQNIQILVDTEDESDRLALLMNPKYFNTIHDILDKLDTINVMCAFGTGNKCAMINDPKNREIMRQQVVAIGKLVDIYTPIFIRMIVLMEKFSKELSQEQSCGLDPSYLATIQMIKDRTVGSLYMRRLQSTEFAAQNKAYPQSSEAYLWSNGTDENFEYFNDIDNSGSSDYLLTFLLMVVVGIIVYVIVKRQ